MRGTLEDPDVSEHNLHGMLEQTAVCHDHSCIPTPPFAFVALYVWQKIKTRL
jgi:hypothetical protein